MILIPNIPKLCFLKLTGGCQGTGASTDHSTCDQCPAGFYGAEGFCSQCANGTQPRNVTEAAEQMDGQVDGYPRSQSGTPKASSQMVPTCTNHFWDGPILMTVGMFMVFPIQTLKMDPFRRLKVWLCRTNHSGHFWGLKTGIASVKT